MKSFQLDFKRFFSALLKKWEQWEKRQKMQKMKKFVQPIKTRHAFLCHYPPGPEKNSLRSFFLRVRFFFSPERFFWDWERGYNRWGGIWGRVFLFVFFHFYFSKYLSPFHFTPNIFQDPPPYVALLTPCLVCSVQSSAHGISMMAGFFLV